MNEIENKIKELFINSVETQMYSNEIDVNENMSSYGINSISYIKLTVAIESEFSIEFSDEDLDYNKFPNLVYLISYVEMKLNIV